MPPRDAAPDGAVLLRAAGIAKRFHRSGRAIDALAGVDLTLRRGEFVVLLGPSGCGKTTLLRILGGLEQPSAGAIAAAGQGAAKPRANMVFQEHGLFPWLRIVDNVAFGLRVRGVPAAARRERALAELRRVGLGHVARAWPSELSGGMRQRANLARAFANDPDLLLMDEPFAALDVQTRTMMQEQLLRLWEADRRTVVFVTHGIEEAILLADRILLMGANPGRLAHEFVVPFARPRDIFALKFDPRFLALSQQLWDLMRDAVRSAFVGEG